MNSSMHEVAAFAIPTEFLPVRRLGIQLQDEWMAELPDGTEIVVADAGDKPSSVCVEKAVSIVQSRTYLETRARQLLVPLNQKSGVWRLVTIDFGHEAQQHECEFLMCFVFESEGSGLAESSPYVEVGFALSVQSGAGPMFVLMIQETTGLKKD